ncbi:MAG: dihydroneopterin aldolase [Bacteroidetes bacterium]|nr:dihydroneopterin aldolase [Bacteroidota bacterium]
MAKISLTGMEFHAFHGCFKEEQIIGNNFMVDLIFETKTEKPEISDDLKDTIDYSKVYKIVKNEMEITSKLLEHVARRILNVLSKAYPQIIFAELTVSKMNPPVGGKVDRVSVTLNSNQR